MAPSQKKAQSWAAVAALVASAVIAGARGYGTCATDSCNDYVESNICVEDVISENQYAPSTSMVTIGIIRDLTADNGPDFAAMCAWQHAKDAGLDGANDTQLIWLDAGEDITGGVRAGLCMRKSGMNLAVGPSYSTVAQGAAMVGTIYEQNTVGTVCTSPLLNDTDTYSYFSRVIASDNFQGSMLARYAVVENDWQKIATISIATNLYFSGITDVFVSTAVELGAEITSYTIPAEFTQSQLEEVLTKIKNSGVRVIMAAMLPMHDTLTVAKNLDMLGEGWGWLTTESAISILYSNLWNLPDSKIDGMETLLDGVIGLVPRMDTESDAYTAWQSCIDEHYNDTTGMFAGMGEAATSREGSVSAGLETIKTMWNGYYYDAMMVTMRALASLDSTERMDATVVREAIRDTPYNGTSGSIIMDSTGERTEMLYEILNIFNETYNVIGYINSADDSIVMTQSAHFPGDTLAVPVDYVMDCDLQNDYDQTVSTCHGSMRTITYTQNSNESMRYCPYIEPFEAACDHALFTDASMPLVVVGLVFVLLATISLLACWNHKVIRLSQREFLLIMMVGAFISLAGPLLSMGTLDELRCAALPCFTAIGYVLLFGPLFVKTWRVNVLVHNTKLRLMKISNHMLYRRLFVLILLTSALLVAMFLVDPPVPVTVQQTVSDGDGTVHLVESETCGVESMTMGILVIVLLGLMTAYGCFVSYKIRNVSSELSEARWIFLSVYNGALLSTVTLSIVLGLDLSYAQLHLYATLGIVLTCIVTVCLIMVPKLINVHKDVTINGSSSDGNQSSYKVSKGPSYLNNTEGVNTYLAGTEGSGGYRLQEPRIRVLKPRIRSKFPRVRFEQPRFRATGPCFRIQF
ncbi:Metabotropic glutamate receptor-like protein E [Hondaea fermentalgiana]|uniref:Metabotropic glutamate receptor-like protein E n=1 Tax=Hondaea fermentalgiana TaxID=2315210 RepID=A0A2R5GEC4_9STRA|nr:Metabotropic glutamate receptor-like protein E [Hondaea fermentalgiana]|eukprot:GBG26571.1 Metabotropic glutamate receptor-like protein E [Hondaea fermentalgiana]